MTSTHVPTGPKGARAQTKVKVMGADVARQVLALGLADRIELQLASMLLHSGARLFESLDTANLKFTLRSPAEVTTVAHLTLDVSRA